MNLAESIILGVVQGITEFFPISSSGHLVVLQNFFGIKEPPILFDVVLHIATLGSIIVFLNKQVIKLLKDKEYLKKIFIAFLFTAVVGLLIKKFSEKIFSSTNLTAVFLIITGIWLVFIKFFSNIKEKDMNNLSASLIGIAQGISTLPGVSRSGATIGMALILGLRWSDALQFSFLLSIPTIIAAAIVEFKTIAVAGVGFYNYLTGFCFAFVSGLLTLFLLFRKLNKNSLLFFGVYCIVVGILILLI